MKNKYQTLAGNTVKLGAGTFASKLLVFLMVRFYTEYLSPADYGAADLITQTANLLLPIASLGITDAVFRFVMDEAEDAGSVFTVGACVVGAGCAVLLLLAAALGGRVLEDGVWLIAVFIMASNLHTLSAQFVRARGDMTLFAVQGLLNTALVIGLNILFLAVFRLGVTGYVLSTAAADLLCTAYLVLRAKLWRYLVKQPAAGARSRMLRYCVPLIPTATFWWVTSVSDRYMITAQLGSAANGIYAVAAKLPTILTVLSSVFMEAWLFSAVTERQGGKTAHLQFYGSVWRTFVAGLAAGAGGVPAFSVDLKRKAAAFGGKTALRRTPERRIDMILTAIHGFCMALADSVPGVSGGTIAFILGFYDAFLDALHSLFGRDRDARRAALRYLARLGAGWAVGMIACILVLSKLFAAHIYFMSSLFLGLTLASFPFVIRAERSALRACPWNTAYALLGLLLVLFVSVLTGVGGGVLRDLLSGERPYIFMKHFYAAPRSSARW